MEYSRPHQDTHGRQGSRHFMSTRSLITMGLVAVFFFGMFSSGAEKSSFSSSEVKFADASPSGLSIVPASCPSNPHYAGECTSPTCSLWVDTNPINQPEGTNLHWTSADATSFSISNVGAVTPNTTSATGVAPAQTTSYSGSVSGPGGSGSCSVTLSVNQYCSFDGQTVTHGSSVTAYKEETVAYNKSCNSQTRTCDDGNLTGSFQYSSCTVNPPASCTLDGQTVAHGSSWTFYSQQTAPSGAICSSYARSRTCTNGSLSGPATYQYASCLCTPTYSCSGATIQYTDASCSTSNVTTCTLPAFCSAGSATCIIPTVIGQLTVTPLLVLSGDSVSVSWDVNDAVSCTVTSSNENESSRSGIQNSFTTLPINDATTFTITCDGADADTLEDDLTYSVTVVPAPTFQEL